MASVVVHARGIFVLGDLFRYFLMTGVAIPIPFHSYHNTDEYLGMYTLHFFLLYEEAWKLKLQRGTCTCTDTKHLVEDNGGI